MKGKNMYGKFEKNKLKSLNVVGNSEVIYYGRDEDKKLIGITRMKCSSNIFITMDNNEIESIDFVKSADGKTYPLSLLLENDKILRGFIWREEEQPLTKEAIFIHDEVEIKKTEIKDN
jgi:hypothetical protein